MLHLKGEKNVFVLLDFFLVVDRSEKVFKNQRDIELLRKDKFECLKMKRKGFNLSAVSNIQQHLFPFALIYFGHKTTFETITYLVSFGFFMLHQTTIGMEMLVCVLQTEEVFRFCFRQYEQYTYITRETNYKRRKLYRKRT